VLIHPCGHSVCAACQRAKEDANPKQLCPECPLSLQNASRCMMVPNRVLRKVVEKYKISLNPSMQTLTDLMNHPSFTTLMKYEHYQCPSTSVRRLRRVFESLLAEIEQRRPSPASSPPKFNYLPSLNSFDPKTVLAANVFNAGSSSTSPMSSPAEDDPKHSPSPPPSSSSKIVDVSIAQILSHLDDPIIDA
jgi:hypothetical protein